MISGAAKSESVETKADSRLVNKISADIAHVVFLCGNFFAAMAGTQADPAQTDDHHQHQ